MVNDPVSDLLARIKNAQQRKKEFVRIPYFKMGVNIVELLKAEKFINNFSIIEEGHKEIEVELKYVNNVSALTYLERVSKPGLRKYVGYKDIRKVRNGMGLAILSTPKGVMSGDKARLEKVGGEYICKIW